MVAPSVINLPRIVRLCAAIANCSVVEILYTKSWAGTARYI